MFGYEFISNTTSANKKDYTVYLKPNIMSLMPDYVNYQKLHISITSNNSLTINIQDTILPPKTDQKKSKDIAQDLGITID